MDGWWLFWGALFVIGATGELVALKQRRGHATLTSKVAELPFVARCIVALGVIATGLHFFGVF